MADDMKWSLADYDALPGTAHAMPSTQTATPGRLARPTTAADPKRRLSVHDVIGALGDLPPGEDCVSVIRKQRDAADRPSVTDNARAETTTATIEDTARAIHRALAPRWMSVAQALGPDQDAYEAMLADIAKALADGGLLATARTRPTREQIARALREGRTNGLCTLGVRCDLCDCDQDYWDDLALRDADAVLALLADQPETTTEWGVRFYGRGPFDVACDSREDAEAEVAAVEDKHAPAVLIRREVTAWTEADQ